MKKACTAVIVTLTLVAAIAIGSGPSAAAADHPYGYTVILRQDGSCELGRLDLVTGELTDLPATASPDSCATDLAVDTDGTVYGIVLSQDGAAPTQANGPSLIESNIEVMVFDPDGRPTVTRVRLPDSFDEALVDISSIVVDPQLGFLIQVVPQSTDPVCATGSGSCLLSYDPATAVATPIGSAELGPDVMGFLTSCADGLIGVAGGPPDERLATVDPLSGIATRGAALVYPTLGLDCPTGGGPLYALATIEVVEDDVGLEMVGTLDPRTGVFSPSAPVSGANGGLFGLGVPPGTAIEAGAPSTTTTTIDVADADAVAPSFTG